MPWFKKQPPRPRKEVTFTALTIQFVGEQDGPPERLLKAQLAELLRSQSAVERAYLARTDYGDATGMHVTLCVKSSLGEDKLLTPKIGDIFVGIFGSHEHLDTLFLLTNQENDLQKVCRPFYVAG